MTTMNDIFGIISAKDVMADRDPDATVVSCAFEVTQHGNSTFAATVTFESSDGGTDCAQKMFRGKTFRQVQGEIYRWRDKLVSEGTPKENVTVKFVKK